MGLISEKLAAIGLVFFVFEWKKRMANVLEANEAQIDAWVGYPGTPPDDIEAAL